MIADKTSVQEKANEFRNTCVQIREQIHRRIVGMEEIVDRVVDALFLGGHVLLEGVPGLGKTLLVKTLAECVDLKFSRIQFTPDLMPADIIGTNLIVQGPEGQKSFRFQRGPVFTHVLLADEINRATPKTQSALLEAMQERSVTVMGETYVLEEPFYVLATQNPIEMEGTYPLPEAQLDRFLYKLVVPYPQMKDLLAIVTRTTMEEVAPIQPVTRRETIHQMSQLILQVPVADAVLAYCAQLVLLTHPPHPEAPEFIQKYIRYGASPRAAQALILSAKIQALKEGRFNAATQDIEAAALTCLRHRLILSIEGQAENVSVDDLISRLVQHVSRQKVS